MTTEDLIKGLKAIILYLCPNCALNEIEDKIIDEIIKNLEGYIEAKKIVAKMKR